MNFVSDEIKLPIKRFLKRVLKPFGIGRGWYVDYFPFVEAKKFGLTKKPHKPRILVTLTSYPDRIATVYRTIHTLLRQTFRPDGVLLWLAETQFPNREKDLPESLLNLVPLGLSIRWTSPDLRSYKKLVPALKEFPDDILVTADDDIYYERTWLKRLVNSYENHPFEIQAHAVRRMTWNSEGEPSPYAQWAYVCEENVHPRNMGVGFGGVLYPPHIFHSDVCRADLFQMLAPQADDLWFWTMLKRRGVCVRLVRYAQTNAKIVENTQDGALLLQNIDGGRNDAQFHQLLQYFPEFRDELKSVQ